MVPRRARGRVDWSEQRGAAAVELGLVLFPLLLLLLGTVEFGRVYAMQYRLQQIARDAARDIAVRIDDPSLPAGGIEEVSDDTLDRELGTWNPDVSRELAHCVAVAKPDGATVAAVTLRMPVDMAIPIDTGPFAVTIVGHAQMPCES